MTDYPCSNTYCPHNGRTKKAGTLCDDCKRRAREIGEWMDELEGVHEKDTRRQEWRRRKGNRKDEQG